MVVATSTSVAAHGPLAIWPCDTTGMARDGPTTQPMTNEFVSLNLLDDSDDRPSSFAFTSLFDRMRTAFSAPPSKTESDVATAAGPSGPSQRHTPRCAPDNSSPSSRILPLRTAPPSLSMAPIHASPVVPSEASDTTSIDTGRSEAWSTLGGMISGVPGFPLGSDVLDDTQSLSQRPETGDEGTSSVRPSADMWIRRFRGEGLSRKYWMADDTAKECRDCLMPFTSLRRKHHCRICGQIFCSRCASNLVPGARWGQKHAIRMCDQCHTMLEEYDRRERMDAEARDKSQRQPLLAPSPGLVPDLDDVHTPQSQFAAKTLFAKDAFPYRDDVVSDVAGSDEADALEDRYREVLGDLSASEAPQALATEVAPFRSGLDEIETHASDLIEAPAHIPPPSPDTSPPSPQHTPRDATEALASLPPLPPSPIKRSTAQQKLMRGTSRFVTSTALGAISLVYFLRMLHQLLVAEHVGHVAEWKETIKLLALAVIDRIRVRTRNMYLTDIRQCVKIKCFPGGRVSDCEFLDGYVCTKNVATRRMASFLPIHHARIMIITFPIEYHRNAKQLMSLDSIMAQEYEFLRILVARITAQRPHVVMAEKGVSHIALSMFEQAGIVVFSRLKRTAIDTIAHCTQADVIASIDRLSLEPRLGRCACISIDTYQQAGDPEQRKPLLRVEVASKEVSCALILRGTIQPKLRRIKAILALMVFVGYNLKLEECVRRDMGATLDWSVMNFHTVSELAAPMPTEEEDVHRHIILDETLKKYQRLLLSASVTAVLPPPYLVTRMKYVNDRIRTLKALPIKSMTYKHTDAQGDVPTQGLVLCAPETYAAPTEVAVLESEHESIQACWHACVSGMSKMLTPFAHQKLVALVFKTCAVNRHTCMGPHFDCADFYGVDDEPLGQFLERTCDEHAASCEARHCEHANLVHYLTYTHNTTQIQMVVEHFPCPLRDCEHELLCWSYCKVCEASTPMTRLSDEAWSLSFAKFLELQCYPNSSCHSTVCEHDYFQNTVRYFALRNLAIRFHADTIEPWDILVPPTRLIIDYTQMCVLRNTEAVKLYDKNRLYWRSVCMRLDALQRQIAAKMLPARLKTHTDTLLTQMMQLAMADGFEIEKSISESYRESDKDMCQLTMNAVRRTLQDRVVEWENLFLDFKKHAPKSDQDKQRLLAQYDPPEADMIAPQPVRASPERTPSFVEQVSPSKSPRRPLPRRDPSGQVAMLTQQYEQMTRDAEQQASRMHRARPVTTTHATVEVFKSLRDAVRGDDSDHEDDLRPEQTRGEAWLGSRPIETPQPSTHDTLIELSVPSTPSTENDTYHDTSRSLMIEEGNVDMTDTSQPERTKLFHLLKAAWPLPVDEFFPLTYPFSPTDHVFTDARVVVREDEPSSIIAFTLDSQNYREQLANSRQSRSDAPLTELRHADGSHYLYEFDTETIKLWCKIFFAEQFDALRHMCGCAEQFVQSLSRCFKWDSRGGKSGSAFLKTRDDRFVVKQLSRTELDGFSKFAPQYFTYLAECQSALRPTALTKIFGYFRIGFKNTHTGRSFKMDFMVMENLLYGRSVDRIFDLKGSTRHRFVQESGQPHEVLQDENLMQRAQSSPLLVREHSKRILRTALHNDSLFLTEMNVMDYSLIMALDTSRNKMVIGIIDYLRTYTWDKRVESFVKETAILGGGGKGEPTIITPRQYRMRFLTFLDRNILMTPDPWIQSGWVQ